VVVHSVSVERDVRQMLAEKISGTHVGLWLLLPEHLRLGTWDLLTAWTGRYDPRAIEPRLALQMVHESAFCVNGIRQQRSLRQKGFETLNGLPFVATDKSIHELLDRHTVAEAASLQVALGQIRQARGHYPGSVIVLDPHRIVTWSRRQMQPKKTTRHAGAAKVVQTFFAIDAESGQPLGFGMGSSPVTITQATLPLIERLTHIVPDEALLIADSEHFTADILAALSTHPKFTVLIPMRRRRKILHQVATMTYTPQWAGYAIAEGTYQLADSEQTLRLIVQRTAEREQEYDYKPFVTTSTMAADQLLGVHFPERWNIEEFFNTEAALGWNRAATLNLHIRFGRLSMALLAQATLCELRQKLPGDLSHWTAQSMAQKLFGGIDGDIRVRQDTILVTFYNPPDADHFKQHYENLPQRLEAEGVDPRVPWLYNFKVDFRFR
jgi:hypothetical protein